MRFLTNDLRANCINSGKAAKPGASAWGSEGCGRKAVAVQRPAIYLKVHVAARRLHSAIEEFSMSFTLPELPYAYEALQPYMSKETLEYHHDKHHQTYVTNANNLIKDSGLEGKSLEEVVVASHGKNVGLFNNAAQHYNHVLYWQVMKPNGG